MARFLNISNHNLTQDQINDLSKMGFDELIELPADLKTEWGQCSPDTYEDLCDRIVDFMDSENITAAHLAGYPAAVVYMCMEYSCFPNRVFYYSHTVRTSEEVANPDGSVTKRNVFKHQGWKQYPLAR